MNNIGLYQPSKNRSLLMTFAALSIFVMHIVCANLYSFGNLDKLLVLWGSSGVDIFLILSGIGIYYSLKNYRGGYFNG